MGLESQRFCQELTEVQRPDAYLAVTPSPSRLESCARPFDDVFCSISGFLVLLLRRRISNGIAPLVG